MKRLLAAALLAIAPCHALAQDTDPALEISVAQLGHVIGVWDVTTEFLNPDESVAGAFDGTYTFAWVQDDEVVSGVSTITDFGQSSGILFYVRPQTREIEMTSVGPGGQLWVMTGPLGAEVRETPVVEMPDGSALKLRFTRFNVETDRFESRMERSTDGGESWVPGNHQLFVRQVQPGSAGAVSEAITVGDGEQALRQSLVLDAPLPRVWSHFTTNEGVSSWMAPVAEVDLRSGGTIRTNYDACGAIGDEGTITLNIVNFLPERFLILRADLDAARDAAWMNEAILERAPDMSNLIEFEALEDGRTLVTSWGLGYGTGKDWEQMIGFFTAGNDWSFGQLRRALAGETTYPACEQSTD